MRILLAGDTHGYIGHKTLSWQVLDTSEAWWQ
jgi:hypothetical protein